MDQKLKMSDTYYIESRDKGLCASAPSIPPAATCASLFHESPSDARLISWPRKTAWPWNSHWWWNWR